MILRHRPRAAHAVVLLLLTASLITACTATGGHPTVGPSTAASVAPSGSTAADCPTSQPDALGAGETRTVTIETDKGTITMSLKADLSPIAVGNFVALAACGYYDGVVFHRIVPGFVIQGGDPTGTGTGGPGYTIADEAVTTEYHRGTVAMARTSQPNSVGSQFFIVVDDGAQPALASANTYQIIGEVTSGMETADAIFVASGGQELPANPVAITTATVANP